MTDETPRPDPLDRVRAVFDEWAETGRAEGMERGHGPTAGPAFERLMAGLPTAQRYLDIGCGNGYSVRWAAARSPALEAVGVDLSPRMIDRARARSTALPNTRFEVAGFPDHGHSAVLEPASFDAIFSMEVFYYLPDLDAALAEVARLLRPGGCFACVVDYYAENTASHDWPTRLGVAMTLRSAAGWAEGFRRAGLEVVTSERLRHDPGADVDTWQIEQGSLFTLGRRPRQES
jgi:SAM-dependent methyltransferase